MKLPIRLNNNSFVSKIFSFYPSCDDPRILLCNNSNDLDKISKAISLFKIGNTYKTTSKNRHKEINDLLLKYTQNNDVILDIGVSDGITSLDLMRLLSFKFQNYFITDFNISLKAFKRDINTFFVYQNEIILVVNNLFVVYPQESFIFKKIYKLKNYSSVNFFDILLLHPEIVKLSEKDNRIQYQKFDVMDRWAGISPSIVKISNLLHTNYFSEEEILKVLKNVNDYMQEGGILTISRNYNGMEMGSIFQKSGNKFKLIDTLANEIDIKKLVLKM